MADNSPKTTPQAYDSAWKDIIREHFTEFIRFYFPDAAEAIDLTHPPRFLDKELQRLARDNAIPDRYADLLVEVRTVTGGDRSPGPGTAGGETAILLCHVEVQGKPVEAFEARLFQYAYRIYDRLGRFPATLVLLTDGNRKFRPKAFELRPGGTHVLVEFLSFLMLLRSNETTKTPG